MMAAILLGGSVSGGLDQLNRIQDENLKPVLGADLRTSPMGVAQSWKPE
jgi:hypothetical protein